MSEEQRQQRLEQELAETIGDKKLRQLADVLVQVDADWKAPSAAKVVRFPFWKKMVVAAVVLLIGTMTWWLVRQPQLSDQELFATYFSPYPMVLTQRSETTIDSDILQKAIVAYNNQNYERAVRLFSILSDQQPKQPLYRLYECVSQLGTTTTTTSATADCFKDLQQYSHLREQAIWYLGLTYLQLGEEKEARLVFKQIGAGAFNEKKAKEILK